VELLSRADRLGSDMQALFVNLQGLSTLNATAGRLAGDAALQVVARTLRVTFRRTDVVARTGGAQFVVLAVDMHEDEQAGVAGRVLRHIAAPQVIDIVGRPVEVSLGWSTRLPGDPRSLEQLLTSAATAATGTCGLDLAVAG
jgi:diguanylate cyclase (GGDEF)-like protein